MDKNELQIVLTEKNIAQENAKVLLDAFGVPFEEAGEILKTYESIKVTEVDDFKTMKLARDKRLALRKIRISVENKRKELKADSLRTGQAIDSVAKTVREHIEPAEEYLQLQEDYAEIKHAEAKAKVTSERLAKLAEYTTDVTLYNVEDMTGEQFTSLVQQLEDQKQASIKAEKEAEAAKVAAEEAEKKRQAEVEAENARLKKEAEAREIEIEKERQVERDKQAKIDAEKEAELAIEREKSEAERVKREALEAEHKSKEEAEAKERAEAEEAERKALLSPDKEKLLNFVKALDMIRSEKLPAVKTQQAQKIVNGVEESLKYMSDRIVEQANTL